jgi:hypothetical protein
MPVVASQPRAILSRRAAAVAAVCLPRSRRSDHHTPRDARVITPGATIENQYPNISDIYDLSEL